MSHPQNVTSEVSKTFPGQMSASQLHPVIERLFEKRGWGPAEIEEFLSWDLKTLPDLTGMHDIEKASERLIRAMDSGEKIGIYGDYDVDGTTSCALFYHFFQLFNIEVELVQPSRFVEGYGIHPPAIDQTIDKGIKVLVTVDCGITNYDAAEYATQRGLDLIITDHHTDACVEMPPAYAVVNPNRRDEAEDSPLRPLAGVAVAFAVCLKIKNILENNGRTVPSIYPLLQFVAIGTICDLAKLTPANVKLVRHGLKQIKNSTFQGIRQFFSAEERKLPTIPSEKLSFFVGPMINSKGRLDHPEIALKLLCTDDGKKSFEYFNHLDMCNKERKFIQAEVYKSAFDQVIGQLGDQEHTISIVYNPEWHEGVIGIVASKLVETFKVPAIVFTDSEEKGIIKASARSAGELNLFNLLDSHREMFLKFGGHKAAAGLSMPKENLQSFISSMQNALQTIPAIERTVTDFYDLEIAPTEITPKLVRDLEILEPYGMGNAKPVFRMENFTLHSYDILKDVHVRWNLSCAEHQHHRLRGISFNFINKWNQPHPEDIFRAQREMNDKITAYFTLGINRFNGNEYIQLQIDRMTIG